MSIIAIVGRKGIRNSIRGFLHIRVEMFAVECLHVVILAMSVVIQEDALLALALLRSNVHVAKQNRQFVAVYSIWS